jgi:hypothetical protein
VANESPALARRTGLSPVKIGNRLSASTRLLEAILKSATRTGASAAPRSIIAIRMNIRIKTKSCALPHVGCGLVKGIALAPGKPEAAPGKPFAKSVNRTGAFESQDPIEAFFVIRQAPSGKWPFFALRFCTRADIRSQGQRVRNDERTDSLRVEFQSARVTSDRGLILVRELDGAVWG